MRDGSCALTPTPSSIWGTGGKRSRRERKSGSREQSVTREVVLLVIKCHVVQIRDCVLDCISMETGCVSL